MSVIMGDCRAGKTTLVNAICGTKYAAKPTKNSSLTR